MLLFHFKKYESWLVFSVIKQFLLCVFLLQKRLKAAEAESKLKQVYIPN